jgi:hypothetical protein
MLYLYLIILIFLILFILYKVYIKVKFGFWAYQPVFHNFNFTYWIKEGIINSDVPVWNKYCNFLNVLTTVFEERSEDILKEISDKMEKSNSFPPLSKFLSYFIGNNNKTYISTYHQSSIMGVLTSRPLNITFKNMKSFIIYYMDHLCIQSDSKNMHDIESELFQTHEYNTHKNTKIKVSLFKRKKKIPGLVELTTCNTYSIPVINISKLTLLHPSMKLIEINKLNLNLLTTFIFNQKQVFDCFALPDLTNLISLITNDTYKIYAIIENNNLIACYFFRDLNLFASVSECKNEIFINGFIKSVHKYAKKIKAELLTIDNISHNNIIINYMFSLNVILKLEGELTYYFYNYAKKPILAERTLLIC